MQDEVFYMRRALELARLAEGETCPNPMVGCVLTDEAGNIVGEGYHHKAGQPHAEVNALADMRKRKLTAQTAYVSLEPCSHFGRTGPCCDALIQAGIKKVVAALEDPNPKVSGQGFARLRAAGVEVKVGVCEAEARQLNERFLGWMTRQRPFVALKYAMTLDGKITTRTRDSHYVTGAEAHKYSHYLRKIYDCILVGIHTVQDDDPELTTRLVEGKNPVRIILDSRARISLTAQVLQGGAKTIIAVGPQAPAEKVALLRQMPEVEVLELPEVKDDQAAGTLNGGRNNSADILHGGRNNSADILHGRLDLKVLMEELNQRKLTSILVEGGSQIHGSFLAAGLVDRVYAFIAPKLVGGQAALSPIGGLGLALMREALPLQVDVFKQLGEDYLISGVVKTQA